MTQELTQAIVDLREDDALAMVDRLLADGVDAVGILADCKAAMDVIGEKFACGEAFIPELIMAGEIMTAVSGKLKPHLASAAPEAKLGVIVVGTVEGDIHDIGKDIVVTMLDIAGFDVVDLGVDVKVTAFIDAAQEKNAQIIAMSCLLTSAIDSMKRVVAAATEAGLRDHMKLMVGGAPITDQVVAYTGADGYGKDAVEAVELAKQWMGVPEMFAENWDKLTADERFEKRFDVWQNPEIEFASDAVKAEYQERVQMFKDAVQLKKPSRPPVAPWIALFPGLDAGLTAKETYYDFDKLYDAWQRFHDIYRPDVLAFTINIAPVKVYDALDYNLYDWPGHGVGEDSGYQYNEAEYMKADEYDKLIADPSNYWQRFYLPRVIGAMQPWTALDPFTDLVEGPMVGPFFIPFGTPPVQDMLKKLMEAGNAALEWIQAMVKMDGDSMAEFGIPGFAGGATKAPYDILGDTMRGTRGLMLDKFRQPDKVLEACDRLVPLAIDWGVRPCNINKHPFVFIPLHKGADGFLSDEDFRTFYWPSLKKVLLGLIEDGITPLCFAEGAYNDRLEAIHDPEIPAGKMIWMFDATNMSEAKKHLGGYQCFGGNVPGALLTTGTVQDMDDYVRQLMEDVAGDGGFILGSGIVIDAAKPECVKAMIDAGKKYGAKI